MRNRVTISSVIHSKNLMLKDRYFICMLHHSPPPATTSTVLSMRMFDWELSRDTYSYQACIRVFNYALSGSFVPIYLLTICISALSVFHEQDLLHPSEAPELKCFDSFLCINWKSPAFTRIQKHSVERKKSMFQSIFFSHFHTQKYAMSKYIFLELGTIEYQQCTEGNSIF